MTHPGQPVPHDAGDHAAAEYHTPLWGWIAIVIAVAMIVGLVAIVVMNLDSAAAAR